MKTDPILDGMSKREQILFAFDELGTPDTAQVMAWLESRGAPSSERYVRSVVGKERDRRGLADTGDLPALTADMLAELDSEHAPAPEPEPAPVDEATAELAARVATAQARLPLQSAEALLSALSDEELEKERDLIEAEREGERELRRIALATKLAVAKREQAEADRLAKEASRNSRWHRRALVARERLASSDARLAQLFQRAEWSSRALIAVVVLGMIWAGINVQHNLVPSGDMGDPLYWISYGIEAMISIPIIVIMVAATTAARWGRKLARGKVIAIELALLALTVTLNAGPHLSGDQPDLATAGEYAIAPFMIGVVIWLHAWVSNHYATLIAETSPLQEGVTR